MSLPSKLKNLNLFNEGNSYLSLVKSVTLPKLARKMESYRGGGMNGAVKTDFGMSDDGLTLEWVLGGLDLIVLRQFGAVGVDAIGLRFAGAYQREDDGGVDAVEIIVRGRHEEIDMGDAKPGEDTEHKIKTPLTYYRLEINGVVEIEIDLLNFKEVVGGVDRMAGQRRAIGLA
ncbi:phage major tail tube protein [Perlucidibaca piscinae]|uniref:phage major tail tube protein n=1 Tax=Perlucidibaca piscinae TaxID=392589 RepID=UPI0003B6BA25|nr:phage major tail tube protein [Perlucidibaca piscinae]